MRKSNPMLSALVQAAQSAPSEQGERAVPSPEQATRETLLGKQSGQALRDVVAEKNALIAELEAKVAAQASAGNVTEVDPGKELVSSRYNPRLERRLRVDALSELLEQIRDAGTNVQPILVRPVAHHGADGKEHQKLEIVYGHRRSKCCEVLGKRVRAVVMQLTDQEVALYQAQENEGQEKPSLYEYGASYEAMLKDGVFPSQSKLSESLAVPPATVGLRILAARVGRPFEEAGFDATMISPRIAGVLKEWFEKLGLGVGEDAARQRMGEQAKELVAAAGVIPGDKNAFKKLAETAVKWHRTPRSKPLQMFEVKGLGKVEVLAKPKETVVTLPGKVDVARLIELLEKLKEVE